MENARQNVIIVLIWTIFVGLISIAYAIVYKNPILFIASGFNIFLLTVNYAIYKWYKTHIITHNPELLTPQEILAHRREYIP